MNINKNKLLTACIIALGVASNTYASPEVEPNNSLANAQALTNGNSYSIRGMMGNIGDTSHDDLDYFKFSATAGDVLTIDIDNGYGGSGNINTIIAIFDESSRLLRMNAYSSSIDSDSTSILDARIDKFVAPSSATYTVAVSNVPRYFINGGGIMGFFGTSTTSVGDYTLNISGMTATSRTKQINIEVKPGNNQLAPLNPRSKGKIPVAIMGSASFSVSDIKQSTLRFGASGNENSLNKCQSVLRDINKDGYSDQLCHFNNHVANFKSGAIEGILKGELDDGMAFEGRALLKVVPSRRK